MAIEFGNLALLIFMFRLTELRIPLRLLTMLALLIGIPGGVLFAAHQYIGGEGTIERVAAYPITAWLFGFGAYTSANHYIDRRKRRRRPL